MKTRHRRVLLDTSFLIALENSEDVHHDRAKQLDEELLRQEATVVLHWGVLLEIGDGYARLSRRAKGISLIERLLAEDGYDIHQPDAALLQRAWDLYRQRPDKQWGLTDCVSFALMEVEQINEALTADVHFQQAGFVALLLMGQAG